MIGKIRRGSYTILIHFDMHESWPSLPTHPAERPPVDYATVIQRMNAEADPNRQGEILMKAFQIDQETGWIIREAMVSPNLEPEDQEAILRVEIEELQDRSASSGVRETQPSPSATRIERSSVDYEGIVRELNALPDPELQREVLMQRLGVDEATAWFIEGEMAEADDEPDAEEALQQQIMILQEQFKRYQKEGSLGGKRDEEEDEEKTAA
jgi:hypothetical protein